VVAPVHVVLVAAPAALVVVVVATAQLQEVQELPGKVMMEVSLQMLPMHQEAVEAQVKLVLVLLEQTLGVMAAMVLHQVFLVRQ
jgi:hypothetical protein